MSLPPDANLFQTTAEVISGLPIVFSDDYQPAPADVPSRIRVFPIPILPPPEKKTGLPAASSDSLTVTFKALKPSFSITLQVHPTDSILQIKERIASSSTPSAPPVASQRLVLKGKALLDNKLLKEYDITDGATINIMIKAGATPAAGAAAPASQPESTPGASSAEATGLSPGPTRARSASQAHGRKLSDIPAVTLSPAPSPGQTTPMLGVSTSPTSNPIPLDLDSIPMSNPTQSVESSTPFHTTIASPKFWQEFYDFLEKKFGNRDDTDAAFEEFLLSAKSKLSPHEIAKIRDSVGVTGMGGH